MLTIQQVLSAVIFISSPNMNSWERRTLDYFNRCSDHTQAALIAKACEDGKPEQLEFYLKHTRVDIDTKVASCLHHAAEVFPDDQTKQSMQQVIQQNTPLVLEEKDN